MSGEDRDDGDCEELGDGSESGDGRRGGDRDAERWDANDARRQRDQMAPPQEACECWCLHCRRVFVSEQMWFQKVIGDSQGFKGFWMCPTANCGGAGFTFDIFPTDPEHPANSGWHSFDEDDEEDEGEYEEAELGPDGEQAGWDPEESKYKAMDEESGDEDEEDFEGEEWKHGLQPGERPEPPWAEEARREWDEEQKKYDQPDERPRELDWTGREREERAEGPFKDDDIPF